MERILVIGYRNEHPRYGWYEVLDKIDNTYYLVRFDKTGYKYKCSKYHILDNHVCDKSNNFFHQVGEEYEHPIYGKYKITKILKGKKAIIEFEKTKYSCECSINNIIKHRVKDVKWPIICGIGYIGRSKDYINKRKKSYAYTCWANMIRRCYDEKIQCKHPTYSQCTVCDEWHCFIEFEKWFNKNYIQDWCLDKDILFKGNKIYSPATCCFVPNEINALFTKRQRHRGNTPIGVIYREAQNGFKACYKATLTKNGKHVYLGCFKTAEEAFNAYKVAKEEWIKDLANKWKDKLDPRVYAAMCNYQVEMTD